MRGEATGYSGKVFSHARRKPHQMTPESAFSQELAGANYSVARCFAGLPLLIISFDTLSRPAASAYLQVSLFVRLSFLYDKA